MTLETEVSLRRFIDSVWFKALARSAAVLGLPLAGAAVGYFMVIGERVTHFLGRVRESILAGTALERTWPPGGPWKTTAEEIPA